MNPAVPIILNASTLRHYATCTRRVWLDAYGDPLRRDLPTPAAQQQFAAGIAHEQIVHQSTSGELRTTLVATWEEGVRLTRQLMLRGARIVNAHLEATLQLETTSVVLRGKVDRLVLLPEVDWTLAPDELDSPLYAPIEIKQYDEPDTADLLQLDCYVWLLGEIQGVMPPAQFWLSRDGIGQPQRKIDHNYDENRLLAALDGIVRLLQAKDDAPPVRLDSHCKACPWFSACRQVAQTQHDVQLIPRLHAETRRHFREAGVVTLDQVIAMTPEELQQFRYIGPKTAPEIHAYAQAFLSGQPVWVDSLPDTCQQPGVFFDIETYPLPDNRVAVWSIGWQDRDAPPEIVLLVPDGDVGARSHHSGTEQDGTPLLAKPHPPAPSPMFGEGEQERSQRVLKSPLPKRSGAIERGFRGEVKRHTITLPDGQIVHLAPDVESVWRVFAGAVDTSDSPVYHWTGYDPAIMRVTAPVDVLAKLTPRLHDLHASLKASVKFPTHNNSLKTIARYLGYGYAGYEDPFAALRDYQLWLQDDNIDALQSACAYQRDDVVATALVWRWLVENSPE